MVLQIVLRTNFSIGQEVLDVSQKAIALQNPTTTSHSSWIAVIQVSQLKNALLENGPPLKNLLCSHERWQLRQSRITLMT